MHHLELVQLVMPTRPPLKLAPQLVPKLHLKRREGGPLRRLIRAPSTETVP